MARVLDALVPLRLSWPGPYPILFSIRYYLEIVNDSRNNQPRGRIPPAGAAPDVPLVPPARGSERRAALEMAMLLSDGESIDWSSTEVDPLLADQLRSIELVALAFRNTALEIDAAVAPGTSAGSSVSAPPIGATSDSRAPVAGGALDPTGERGVSSSRFRWGHLLALEQIGRGSYGEVHRAFDTVLHREVALKLLRLGDHETPDHYLDEARRLAQIRHPNVVTVHGADVHDGRVGIWCDLLRGETLREVATGEAAGKPVLLPARIIEIGRDLARALGAIHAVDLMHGDVKPSNVFIEGDGNIVLFDLGSGRKGSEARVPLTGTPAFLPPEAFTRDSPVPTWDLYALGVLLFYISSAEYPYPATTLRELRRRQESGDPKSLGELRRDLPGAFTSVVDRMLARSPDDRLASAKDVERALEACLQQVKRQATILADSAEPGETAARHNLPDPELSFVGRSSEVARVAGELSTHRCVTLAGSGGCGKTRLAIEVARRHIAEFPDGVYFVDLSRISESARVGYFVAETLEISLAGGESPLLRVSEHLRTRRSLLILDNCEHVLEGARDLLQVLLSVESATRVLATSREALSLAFEHVHPVPSLEYPSGADVPIGRILDYEAVDLLVERIRDVDARFRVTQDTVEPVVRIVRRLDGIPLALELAAERARILSVQEIADRLEDRFALLSSGRGISRHRTLRAMLDWSYEQLERDERLLLCRLSVFTGDWSVEAMEHVCVDDGPDASFGPAALLDAADGLRRKWLLRRGEEGTGQEGGGRFSMLESVREYAEDRLFESESADRLRVRHAEYYLSWATRVAPGLVGNDQPATLKRMARDHDNVLQAIATFRAAGRVEDAAQLAKAVAFSWWTRGHWLQASELFASLIESWQGEPTIALIRAEIWQSKYLENEGRYDDALALLDRALEQAKVLELVDDTLWSVQSHRGQIAYTQGDYASSRRYLEDAVRLAREQKNHRGTAICLSCLGNTAQLEGKIHEARRLFEESSALCRKIGDRAAQCYADLRFSDILFRLEDLDAAEHAARQALSLATELDDRSSIGIAHLNLGDLDLHRGRLEAARDHFVAAHASAVATGHAVSQAFVHLRLARTEHRLDSPGAAYEHVSRLIDLIERVGNARFQFDLAMLCFEIAIDRGRTEAAARFLGTADGIISGGLTLPPYEQEIFPEQEQKVRDRLGAERAASLREEGRRLGPVDHARVAELGLLADASSEADPAR